MHTLQLKTNVKGVKDVLENVDLVKCLLYPLKTQVKLQEQINDCENNDFVLIQPKPYSVVDDSCVAIAWSLVVTFCWGRGLPFLS